MRLIIKAPIVDDEGSTERIPLAAINRISTTAPLGMSLAVVKGSLRFHKVNAIKTKAITYRRLQDHYMNDKIRNRSGFGIEPVVEMS
jgi:hypothetical protein